MSEESDSPTPLLDEWRAEARAQITDGSLRGFSDKDDFADYLQGPRRRSA